MAKKVDFFLSLNALLGVHGVRTSMLMSNQDYWMVAKALWPQIREEKDDTLQDLQRKIKGMSKAQRRKDARQNLRNIPAAWFSEAPVHQHRLVRSRAG